MEKYFGEIRLFAGNRAPDGWQFCAGQILSIQANTALYTLIGTIYGGNGVHTFALPDLRGRVPVGFSSASPIYTTGDIGGDPTATLRDATMPRHTHQVRCNSSAPSTAAPNVNTPVNNFPAVGVVNGTQPVDMVYTATAPAATPAADGQMNSQMLASTGSATPFGIMQPSLAINYIICTDDGLYPQRP